MRTSCTLPLDPPLNILSSIRLDGRTLYSTENGSLILENWACFAECYLFLGCGFGESVYSIAYFLREEEQDYIAILQLYPQPQSEYYASLKRFSFFFIASLLGNATVIRTGTFRPPPLLYRPRGPGKLSSATAKQSNRANINKLGTFILYDLRLVSGQRWWWPRFLKL